MWLPGSKDSLTIGWAVSTQYQRVTDRQTDRQPISITCALWLTHTKNRRPKCKMDTRERQLTRFYCILQLIYKENRTKPTVFQNRTETEQNLKNPFRTSLIIAHMGWATFLLIVVFLEGFVLDLSRPVRHLSYSSRDLATLTFDLGGHGACPRYGSLCSICVPSLKFVGLPVRKILCIYCVSINPPGDLDLWPFDL